MEGGGYVLSPDGEWLAAYNEYSADKPGVNILFRNFVTGARVESTVPEPGRLSWTNLIWSPDSKHVALSQLTGTCPDEDASTVVVVRAADGQIVVQQPAAASFCCPPGVGPVRPTAWDGPNRVLLGSLRGLIKDREFIEVP